MALRIGIAGRQNTGKSYSRKFIKKGEECFVISPSRKMNHLFDSKNKAVERLDIATEKSKSIADIMQSAGLSTRAKVVNACMLKTNLTITGNYDIVQTLQELEIYLNFIDKKYLNIKNIFLPDFTHYISRILADDKFISRKAGGEAFQRFWELAADALNRFFLSIDELREDLVVITEFHTEYDEIDGTYKIFVPGGKMLTEKFLPDSYYDVLLYTHVLDDEDSIKEEDRYKFVTKRTGKYNARCAGLFTEAMIPNNIDIVIEKVRNYNNL
jgi:hypothetical protein